MSTATICSAPASRAPCTQLSPTPPQPMTTTLAPGSTFAVLTTAPTPVMTEQPTRLALSSGMSSRTGTAPDSGTTAYSANEAMRAKWWMSSPLRWSRGVPSNMNQRGVSAPLQRTGRPSTQWTHQPQFGRKLRMTGWPGFTWVQPGPTFSTIPAASWPRTIGSGIVHSPFITW